MKHLKESILVSIGQGDNYFLKKYELDPKKVKLNKDGTIDYYDDVYIEDDEIEQLPFKFNFVAGEFHLLECKKLKTLEGCPKKLRFDFDCSWCYNLESLEGAPQQLGGNFSLIECKKLKTLEGYPKHVEYDFECEGCDSLVSLKGSPIQVGGNFQIQECKNLKDIKGCPKEVGGNFCCTKNGRIFTEKEIKNLCEVGFGIIV